MEPIVFKQGEETGIVIQKDNFSQSLLFEQHKAAIHIIEKIWRGQQSVIQANKNATSISAINRVEYNESNIVCFCGDRGEGKTSCMLTVREILSNDNVRSQFESAASVIKDINSKAIEVVKMIEPAHFDRTHNIIELLLGQMFAQFKAKQLEPDNDYKKSLCLRESLKKAFEKAQDNLSLLHKERKDLFDKLENLESLAASMSLAESIRDLFAVYLEYMAEKDGRLLICVDDIDLNMTEAYTLTEEIRKYLSNEYCIILMALKIEQLQNVVTSNIARADERFQEDISIYAHMAEKYIAKLLPMQNRIDMPHVTDFAEEEIKILDSSNKPILQKLSVKEAVLTLIAQKTQYLFYNMKGEVSPMIPRNLRGLRHLIGLLVNMGQYDYSEKKVQKDSLNEENIYNQRLFRNYFFNEWIKNLIVEDQQFVRDLLMVNNVYAINITICKYLCSRYREWVRQVVGVDSIKSNTEIKKQRSNRVPNKEDELNADVDETGDDSGLEESWDSITIKANSLSLLREICGNDKVAYNVSTGDVLYLVSVLSKTMTDDSSRYLLFFIQAYYSIQLYENYNRITENEGLLYPEFPNEKEISREEKWFEHVNTYQKFTNGSVFTFAKGEILPFEKKEHIPNKKKKGEPQNLYRDSWRIMTNKLFAIMSKVMTELSNTNNPTKETILQLNICEYLLLSAIHSSAVTTRTGDLTIDRRISTPNYTHEYGHATAKSFAIFNPLALFSNGANIRYAYNRMGATIDDKSFFDIAIMCPQSLLCQMLKTVASKDDFSKSKSKDIEFALKKLSSNMVIRNVDVHSTILQSIAGSRDELSKKSKQTKKQITAILKQLYEIIKKDTIIKYYYKERDGYNKSELVFLDPLIHFLENDSKIFEGVTDIVKTE